MCPLGFPHKPSPPCRALEFLLASSVPFASPSCLPALGLPGVEVKEAVPALLLPRGEVFILVPLIYEFCRCFWSSRDGFPPSLTCREGFLKG